MARVKRIVDPEVRQLREEIGKEVVEALKEKLFEVEGTPLATVKYADATFKKKTLIAGWEFFVSYAYTGANGDLIFGLTPEDDQEYDFVEMKVADFDFYFPMVGPAVAEALGVKGEKLGAVLDAHGESRLERAAKVAEDAKSAYTQMEGFGAF